ncbi:MAG: transposase [Elusimicrobiota bacterium]|nr:transposase [Elusimicrobiota bacterium]
MIKVYLKIINNTSKKELLPIIKRKICIGPIIHTDCWKSYDVLIVDGYKRYRIHHSKNEFAKIKNHIT